MGIFNCYIGIYKGVFLLIGVSVPYRKKEIPIEFPMYLLNDGGYQYNTTIVFHHHPTHLHYFVHCFQIF